MIAIDTNILVRYLTNDDEAQVEQVNKLFTKYVGKNHSLFINNIVLCELIWVLERGYKYPKPEIVKALKMLMTAIEFIFEDHKLVFQSILEYEKTNFDFSDIMIGMVNKGRGFSPTYSLDKTACRQDNFTEIEYRYER